MTPRASSIFAAALAAVAWSLAGLAGCSSASNGLGGANGHQTCASAACPNGQSYQACTTTDPSSGACTGISYSVGGQTFNCASCGDCSEAAQQVAATCEGNIGDGGTGSSSGGGSGGSSGGGSGSSSGGSSGGACSAPQACGTGGRTYEECTNLTPNGQCQSIVYKVSDGKSFTCPGCTSCTSAAQQLATYCASTSGNQSCTSSVPCGSSGLTYEECTTTGQGGACESIQYKLSNGNDYTCASCSDCTAAVQSLDTYCQNQGTPTTTCTSWATCGTSSLSYETCTTSLNGACQSIYYETSDGLSWTCNSCSDCSSASTNMENHCASQTTMTSCGSATACGNTGVTYQQCETTTGGSCTSIYYSTTDGHTYTCNSCSDCSSASTSLTSYCSSLQGTTCGTSTCSTGYLCCNCSGTQECLSSGGGAYTCASYSCQ